MKSNLKLKILFVGGMALGVGLMIGGIFVPVLLPIGGAIIAAVLGGSLGLWQGLYAKQEAPRQEARQNEGAPTPHNSPASRPRGHSDPLPNVQNNMFYIYGGHQDIGNGEHETHRYEPRSKLALV